MDPDKVSAIIDFPVPRSVKQVRRFLGMTGWYRKFIGNYASITTLMLSSKRKVVWTEEAQKAFEVLKSHLNLFLYIVMLVKRV